MLSDESDGRLGWREATERALYGPDGFFVRERPAGHFRTSVHASSLFSAAVAELLARVDEALGRPERLALVDVGAGGGELLTGVLASVPRELGARLRPCAVERAPRPELLDERIEWRAELPEPGSVTGLLFANEWLDNVPVDVVEVDPEGSTRLVTVRADGSETLGGAELPARDAAWLARWWPLGAEPGLRAEIGHPRDAAWARAVRSVDRGLAVAVDYAHDRAHRPPFGTLTGYRDGREVRPVPDGSCDITAHVALDACAAAGADAAGAGGSAGARDAAGAEGTSGAGGTPGVLTQRAALHALGVTGRRPPLSLASADPAAYVRALSSAGEAAELTDPSGLGAFGWLLQPVRLAAEALATIGLSPEATTAAGTS